MVVDVSNKLPKSTSTSGFWLFAPVAFCFALLLGTVLIHDGSRDSSVKMAVEQERLHITTHGFRAAVLLLNAAAKLAEERGIVYTALMRGGSLTPQEYVSVWERRASADFILEEALAQVEAGLGLSRNASMMTNLMERRAELEETRKAFDQISISSELPSPEMWFATSSRLIGAAESLLLLVHHKVVNIAPEAKAGLAIQHYVWIAGEYAGRERALLSGMIAQNKPLESPTLQYTMKYRNRVLNAWLSAKRVVETLHDHLPSGVMASVSSVDHVYFGDLQERRKELEIASANNQTYPVSAEAWFTTATEAMQPIFQFGELAVSTLLAPTLGTPRQPQTSG